MRLDKNTLLNKPVGDILDLCIKLNSDNEELRKKINTLNVKLGTIKKRETNTELRAENRKLKSKLESVLKVLTPQEKK